jgi:hypothetical protein
MLVEMVCYLWTMIFLISTSVVAGIAAMSHCALPDLQLDWKLCNQACFCIYQEIENY